MLRRIAFLAILLATITILCAPAQAWLSVRTATRNFERAWSAAMSKRDDAAREYFQRSADAFGQALAENPPSRTTTFLSNLAMAGMSLYEAGRYRESVEAMAMARNEDRGQDAWEVPLYLGLARGQLGERKEMMDALQSFLDIQVYQPMLSNAVSRELAALEQGTATPEAAAGAIHAAAMAQFDYNVNIDTLRNDRPDSACNGRFWWRTNAEPCSHKTFFEND